MFIDFLSWISTQLFVIGFLVLIYSLYDDNIRQTKINNARATGRYKNKIIRENVS